MKYRVTLNKKVYEVEVEKGEAILLDEYAAVAPAAVVEPAPSVSSSEPAAAVSSTTSPSAPTVAGANDVTSPLPGSIFDVKVKVGDSVNAGDVLLIIEAMKMENEVVAARGGRVTAVHVAKGDTVETGVPMLTLE